MIADSIGKQIQEAMKAHDEIRLSTLRMLLSALNYEKIAKQHELSSDEEITVVQREAKKRKDAIDAYEKVCAMDRAEKEKIELPVKIILFYFITIDSRYSSVLKICLVKNYSYEHKSQ